MRLSPNAEQAREMRGAWRVKDVVRIRGLELEEGGGGGGGLDSFQYMFCTIVPSFVPRFSLQSTN